MEIYKIIFMTGRAGPYFLKILMPDSRFAGRFPDEENWCSKPWATVPPKFYGRIYSIRLRPVVRPDVRFARVRWKMSRWRKEK
jgi:hypothetical protein